MRELVYVEGERLSHIITWTLHRNTSMAALCGKSPWPGRWADGDAKKSMRLCVACGRKLRK